MLLSNLESGENSENYNMVNCDVCELIEKVVRYYERKSSGKKLLFNCDTIDREKTMVEANEHLLYHAFANVVENALKYTPDEGEVEIQCMIGEDESLRVEFRDNGPGIKEKERVFERFYREPSEEEGFGLGLSVVRHIARLHNCQVQIFDRSGGGSIVQFQFGTTEDFPNSPSV